MATSGQSRKTVRVNNQTFPPIRQNTDCGVPAAILAGREPLQLRWYEWARRLYADKNVLDVGCGSCEGLKTIRRNGAKSATGQDVDDKLAGLDDSIIICPLDKIQYRSFDVVLCIDVIEHVIDDFDFFRHLIGIAKHSLMITTPNYSRSKARNKYHCREYTILQFMDYFKPDELWVSASGGTSRPARLAGREIVDSDEWAHICGIWTTR